GGGPAILMGGDGDDVQIGGRGRDLLIGGLGADSLTSAFAGDILIGGTTRFDSDPTALASTFSDWVWNGPHAWKAQSRDSKPDHENPKRPDFLSSADVLDDGIKDTIVGRRGTDQIFATTAGVVDDVVLRKGSSDWQSLHDRAAFWQRLSQRFGSYSLIERLT